MISLRRCDTYQLNGHIDEAWKGPTFEARGVISTVMSLPSSSFLELTTALVARRFDEDVKLRLGQVFERLDLARPFRIDVKGMLGRRKSRGGVVCLEASWRNARAVEGGFECISCEQLLAIDRVAMLVSRV